MVWLAKMVNRPAEEYAKGVPLNLRWPASKLLHLNKLAPEKFFDNFPRSEPNMPAWKDGGMSHGGKLGSVPIPAQEAIWEFPTERKMEVPEIMQMYRKRRDRPPLQDITLQDMAGNGEYIFYPMPAPEGVVVGKPEEASRLIAENLAAEWPQVMKQAKDLHIWKDSSTRPDAVVGYDQDDKPLVAPGIRQQPGGEGCGMFVRMQFHASSAYKVNLQRGGTRLKRLVEGNSGVKMAVEVRGKDLIFQIPKDSPLSYSLFTGTGWVARPYAARFLEVISALGTGKHTRPTDGEFLRKHELARGLASRQCVPVLHWEGSDNGIPQEYAMLVLSFAKGEDYLSTEEPAGMVEGGETFS